MKTFLALTAQVVAISFMPEARLVAQLPINQRLNEESIVAAILIGSSQTREAVDHGNAQVRALYERVSRLQAQVNTLRVKFRGKSEQASRIRLLSVQLDAERRSLIKQLSDADERYALTLKQFRSGIADFTTSDDPRIVSALQRFSHGDSTALQGLKEYVQIIRRVREVDTRIRNGSEARAIAYLSEIARERGDNTVADVLANWKEAIAIDPADFGQWYRVCRLYLILLDYEQAKGSAEKALQFASNGGEQEAARDILAETYLRSDRPTLAIPLLLENSEAVEARLKLAPNELFTLMDFSGRALSLGNAYAGVGSYDEARRSYQRAYEIRRNMLQQYPKNVSLSISLAITESSLGWLQLEAEESNDGYKLLQAAADKLRRAYHFAPYNPSIAREFSVVLGRLASYNFNVGNADVASSFAVERVNVLTGIFSKEPTGALYIIELSDALNDKSLVERSLGHWLKAVDTQLERLEVLSKAQVQGAGEAAISLRKSTAYFTLFLAYSGIGQPIQSEKYAGLALSLLSDLEHRGVAPRTTSFTTSYLKSCFLLKNRSKCFNSKLDLGKKASN